MCLYILIKVYLQYARGLKIKSYKSKHRQHDAIKDWGFTKRRHFKVKISSKHTGGKKAHTDFLETEMPPNECVAVAHIIRDYTEDRKADIITQTVFWPGGLVLTFIDFLRCLAGFIW